MDRQELKTRIQDILRIPSASSFDSTRHQGNRKVAEYLAEWVGKKLNFQIIDSPDLSQDVTFISWPKGVEFPSQGGLALHTHLDTVHAGDLSRWTEGGPLEARENGSFIVGLGAADVKSDAICKLGALMEFADTPNFTLTPFFVGSFAEEVGMQGARWLSEASLIKPQYAMVGEPSNNQCCYANKGLMIVEADIEFQPETYAGMPYRIHYEGASGHSSAPAKAINALELALDDLEYQIKKGSPIGNFKGSIAPNVIPGDFEFLSYESQIPKTVLQNLTKLRYAHRKLQRDLENATSSSHFEPPTASSSWTVLERRKDSIHLQIEGRYLPGQNAEELLRDFLATNPDLHLKRISPSCWQEPKGHFAKTIEKLVAAPEVWITKSGSNEAYFYQNMGAEVFVYAPGQSYGNIHRPNEKIELSSAEKAQRFYKELMRNLCLS